MIRCVGIPTCVEQVRINSIVQGRVSRKVASLWGINACLCHIVGWIEVSFEEDKILQAIMLAIVTHFC